MNGRVVYSIAAAIALSAVTSCTRSDSHPSTPPAGESVTYSYSNVWSAVDNIDVFSRGVELVRAAVEAGTFTPYVGQESSYPGYSQAVQGNEEGIINDVLDKSYIPLEQPVGVSYDHIIDYSASGKSVTATVCSIDTTASSPARPLDANNSMHVYTVELHNAQTAPGAPGVPDVDIRYQHPDSVHRAPNWNAFGTWKISKFRDSESGSDGIRCQAWWPEYCPTLTYDAETGVYFPPGFTDFAEPVKAQYPKWIAPANGG